MTVFVPGATFLGRAIAGASQATVGPVVWSGQFSFLYVYHFIAGYSGAGGIALLQLGTGATPDTGANYSYIANLFNSATTLVAGVPTASATGIKVAQDSVTTARRGHHEIHNSSINAKFIDCRTTTYAAQNPTAATAITSQSLVTGTWFNNGQVQSVQMIGNGVSLLTGSFIDVFGIPGI